MRPYTSTWHALLSLLPWRLTSLMDALRAGGNRARRLAGSSNSLADVISFGVAPAAIAYGCGMRGLYDMVVLTYFVACGVSRLARYNITAKSLSGASAKVTHFEGTPIPTSVVLVLMLAMASALDATGAHLWGGELSLAGFTLHPIALLFGISGSLMISRLRIPKL